MATKGKAAPKGAADQRKPPMLGGLANEGADVVAWGER